MGTTPESNRMGTTPESNRMGTTPVSKSKQDSTQDVLQDCCTQATRNKMAQEVCCKTAALKQLETRWHTRCAAMLLRSSSYPSEHRLFSVYLRLFSVYLRLSCTSAHLYSPRAPEPPAPHFLFFASGEVSNPTQTYWFGPQPHPIR